MMLQQEFAAGSSLKRIPEGAFRETCICDFVIPTSVRAIGALAFIDCM